MRLNPVLLGIVEEYLKDMGLKFCDVNIEVSNDEAIITKEYWSLYSDNGYSIRSTIKILEKKHNAK